MGDGVDRTAPGRYHVYERMFRIDERALGAYMTARKSDARMRGMRVAGDFPGKER
jgi:hypothetical protein